MSHKSNYFLQKLVKKKDENNAVKIIYQNGNVFFFREGGARSQVGFTTGQKMLPKGFIFCFLLSISKEVRKVYSFYFECMSCIYGSARV